MMLIQASASSDAAILISTLGQVRACRRSMPIASSWLLTVSIRARSGWSTCRSTQVFGAIRALRIGTSRTALAARMPDATGWLL